MPELAEWIRWLLPALTDTGVGPALPDVDEDVARMIRLAAGDEGALQQLFDRWKRPLLSFIYRSLGSHADAEDLTLEVFVRLHRAAANYRPTARFSTYLFQIAQNLVRNEQRRRQRKPAVPVPPEVFDHVQSGVAGSDQRIQELEEVLGRALARLPERARAALLLVVQQRTGTAEAAATLGLTENALRVLVHRARQQLKIEMEALT